MLSFSCRKIVTDVVTVNGNVPPKDTTIDNVLRDNYVQKLYLDAIGRTPTSLEKLGAQSILNKNNCSIDNRTELLNQLTAMTDFRDHLYGIDNAGILNSPSSVLIGYYIIYYQKLAVDTTQPLNHAMYAQDVQRLYILKAAYRAFLNDSIDLVEVQKRMAFSPMYEAIIGGAFNWTTAAFPYFLKRKPTTDETMSSYYILQGIQAQFLLKLASNKSDMMNIFFDSDEFFECQIRTFYLRYFYREPTTSELSVLAPQYHKDHDYIKLLRTIFLSNEYLGKK